MFWVGNITVNKRIGTRCRNSPPPRIIIIHVVRLTLHVYRKLQNTRDLICLLCSLSDNPIGLLKTLCNLLQNI